jgi:hypothetical protein
MDNTGCMEMRCKLGVEKFSASIRVENFNLFVELQVNIVQGQNIHSQNQTYVARV